MKRLTVLPVVLLLFAPYLLSQEAEPPPPRIVVTDPTPASTCDLEQFIAVARASILEPKDEDKRKAALDMIDKCERILEAIKKFRAARQETTGGKR